MNPEKEDEPSLKIRFDLGMLIFDHMCQSVAEQLGEEQLKHDARALHWSAPAYTYRNIISSLHQSAHPYVDRARSYKQLNLQLKHEIIPRDHQKKALEAWKKAGGQGVVSLPTGAGKTILAVLSIASVKRSTLVVVPTIDLLLQWQSVLQHYFEVPIGAYGGGYKELTDITVVTYDSAHMIIESVGGKFGFVVFDECHHLPSPQYQLIAKAAIAPYRLGLSATVERSDGKEELIYQLLGKLVFEGHISEMVSQVLSPYDVVQIKVELSESERQAYTEARQVYVNFVRKHRINMSTPTGWGEFIRKSASHHDGPEAMRAYRQQKNLSQGAEGKVSRLWQILSNHLGERIIIFTHDNQLAYRIGCEYFLPVLTHQTKAKERKRMLGDFRSGEIDILVTSKVLNEGVDVPEASVGIVVSGSATVREHVQRLGRILRHRKGKRAVLYELISKDTSEFYVNQRRRRHSAYQESAALYKKI